MSKQKRRADSTRCRNQYDSLRRVGVLSALGYYVRSVNKNW